MHGQPARTDGLLTARLTRVCACAAGEGNGAAWSAAEGRVARVQRETKETTVDVALNLDGTGRADNQSGIHFLDHMLDVSAAAAAAAVAAAGLR